MVPRTNENFLVNRAAAPEQNDNLWDRAPEARARMLRLIVGDMIDEEGFPPEQLERLGLKEHEPA